MDRFCFIKNDIKDLTKKLRFYKGGLVGLLLLFFFFFFLHLNCGSMEIMEKKCWEVP